TMHERARLPGLFR
ncbi:unnamed protein product, partial [Oikopleura dioica]